MENVHLLNVYDFTVENEAPPLSNMDLFELAKRAKSKLNSRHQVQVPPVSMTAAHKATLDP